MRLENKGGLFFRQAGKIFSEIVPFVSKIFTWRKESRLWVFWRRLYTLKEWGIPLKFTGAIRSNYEFRRLYKSGKSAVSPLLAVYCRKNRLGENRLGLTVGTKVGKAVVRNRVRRRLKEIYRLRETQLARGWDIVVVARVKSRQATYGELQRDMLRLFKKLGLLQT